MGGGMASEPPVSNTAQKTGAGTNVLEEKRRQARIHIASIATIDDAKALLNRLCDEGGEWLLDKING